MSPSPFMIEWIERLRLRSDEGSSARHGDATADRREPKRALDVAMGRGRHALALARAGFRTFGVDARLDALRDAAAAAAADGLQLRLWCADLTHYPLPPSRFDLVLVSRYLQRDLFPSLQAAAMPRGVVLYETFTAAQRALGTGPRSPDHLLEDGELRARFEIAGWDVLYYEETRAPEAVARLAARRSA